MRDYDGSQVLFRLAVASARRAARRSTQAADSGGDSERRARSFDASMETVVLLQASAEAWIHRLYEANGMHERSGGWRARWNGIGAVAETRGRPRRSISSTTIAVLDDIEILRNFIVHGDAGSRTRLSERSGDQDLHDILTADYANALVRKTQDLWSEAREITGQDTPFTQSAWVAPDEFL